MRHRWPKTFRQSGRVKGRRWRAFSGRTRPLSRGTWKAWSVFIERAAQCSRYRAFNVTGALEPTLLPVIDMANHEAENPAAHIVETDSGSFQVRVVLSSLGVRCSLLWLWKAGCAAQGGSRRVSYNLVRESVKCPGDLTGNSVDMDIYGHPSLTSLTTFLIADM